MDDEEQLSLEPKVQYACPHAPMFTLHLSGGDVQAVSGLMTVTAEQNREILKLMRTRPDVRSHLMLIDTAAAEALIKADIAARQPAALQGALNTGTKNIETIRDAIEGQRAEALTGSANPQPLPGASSVTVQVLDDRQPVTTDVAKTGNSIRDRLKKS